MKDAKIINVFFKSSMGPKVKKESMESLLKLVIKPLAMKASASEQMDRMYAKVIMASTETNGMCPRLSNVFAGNATWIRAEMKEPKTTYLPMEMNSDMVWLIMVTSLDSSWW